MDMGQMFKFWVPSTTDKNRFLAFVKLESIRLSFVDHMGRA